MLLFPQTLISSNERHYASLLFCPQNNIKYGKNRTMHARCNFPLADETNPLSKHNVPLNEDSLLLIPNWTPRKN